MWRDRLARDRFAPSAEPKRWEEATFSPLRGRWWHLYERFGVEVAPRANGLSATRRAGEILADLDRRARLRCRLLVVVAALLVACDREPGEAPASASPASASPRSVVQDFYAATIAQRVTGAPTAAQLTSLAPYLSDTLRALLVAARQRTEADAARDPNEKPAFVEGDLFSSLFEGPNAVEVVADSTRGDQQVVTVRMTSTTANPPVRWTDRVVLMKERGRYVIDDVEYAGTWDFASKGTLSASIVEGLATSP